MLRCLCLLLPSLCAAATLHVAPGGSDAPGRGDAATPYRSMAYAVARAVAGDTVQLAPGDYVETAQTLPRDGVRIVGAGSSGPGRTLVRAPTAWDFRADLWTENLGGYVVRIAGRKGCAVEGIAFDGNGGRANGAIHCGGSTDVRLRGLAIADFRYHALRLVDSQRLDVRDLVIRDSGFEHPRDASTPFPDGGSLGALGLTRIADAVFADIDIASTAPHGYGIKAGSLDRCEFVRLRFAMHPFQSWMATTLGGSPGNFDIEVHGGHIRQCVFHHCRFTATVSLMGGSGAIYDDVDYSAHFHHNQFDLGGDYGVELGTDKLVFDHNDFVGAWTMLQNYGDSATRIRELVFCHNVARDVGMRVIGSKGDTDDLRCFGNTIVMSQDGGQGYLVTIGSQRDSRRWGIANNLMVGDAAAPAGGRWLVEAYQTTQPPIDVLVRHNLLCDVGAAVDVAGTLADPTASRHVYAGNLAADPLLTLAGTMPSEALAPSAASPAVDAGDAAWGMRSAFVGAGRDIGAFERGAPAWRAGPDSTDDGTYVWAPRTLTTDSSFTGSLAVDLYTPQTGVEIRYTLDGSEPHAGSTLYAAPIRLTAAAQLRARCFRDGWGSPSALARDFSVGADGYPNLALAKPATCSSSWDAGLYGAAKAFDGDTYSWIGWAPAAGDSLPWVAIDLGAACRIRYVELFTRAQVDSGPGGRRNFAIQGANRADFADAVTLASQGATALPYEGVFRAEVTVATAVRYVRAIKTVADEGFFATELVVRGEGANTAPAVALTAPASDGVLPAIAGYQLRAHAIDREGALARVDFLVDGVVVGSDRSAPFACAWAPTPGTYAIIARAIDAADAATSSTVRTVTVTANRPPVLAAAAAAQPVLMALP